MLKRFAAFWKAEGMLLIALLAALVSMLFVPLDAGYLSYLDPRVLCLLFALMAVVQGFESCGLFRLLSIRLLTGRRPLPLLVLLFSLLPFFLAMLVTNDVALIACVPFTLVRLFHPLEMIAAAIRDCLDYGKNPEKTEGKYISAYEYDPATVAEEFLLAKASYKASTGREQKKETDVLCYQIRMAFYPGEITPKEANRIGYELAMRWTKGRHAFLVTTHTDKKHMASNFRKLHYFAYLMEYSCLKTLASKHKTSLSKTIDRFNDGRGKWSIPYKSKLGSKRRYFANYADCKGKGSAMDYISNAAVVYGYAVNTLENRLKAKVCELCGTTESDHYEVHHINKLKNFKGKERREIAMIAKRRKTLVVCRDCHRSIIHKK